MIRQFVKKLIPDLVLNAYHNRHFHKEDWIILPKKEITYSNDLLYTFHNADFMKEPRFEEAYRMAKEIGGALLKDYDIQWRIHVLCWAGSHAAHLEGDFVDCGVFSGFCPRAVMHYVGFEKLNKTYYLMDTFSGMDTRYSSEYEMQRDKKLGYKETRNLYEQVKETFKDFRVDIIKGSIPDTLPQAKTQKVCYLSIDMNSVQPEVAALEYFWDKMVSGGLIILDDYGYPGCLDQKLAHDAFAKSKNVKILSLPTCQGLIIKP